MLLYLHPYPPYRDTLLELPDTGLVVVSGLNGSGKSTLVEAYAAAHWGRSLRGASPWRSPDCHLTVTHPCELRVERTPTDLTVNRVGALKPSKKQPELSALVGDFATWQRTRVFDADLTARFGAAGDADRKRLLEGLLGLEKLDAGLERCRKDARGAEGAAFAAESEVRRLGAAAAEHPHVEAPSVEALALAQLAQRAAEQSAEEASRMSGEAAAALRQGKAKEMLAAAGKCGACGQGIPLPLRAEWHRELEAAQTESVRIAEAHRAALSKSERARVEARRLREQRDAAERAASAAARRGELQAQLAAAEVQWVSKSTDARRLREVEAFIVELRQKLLDSHLAVLESAASAWLPGLSLRVEGDGLVVRHGARTYKELNEGHRRLCDLAVLLGLSGLGDAKVRGPIWLEGCLYGLDEEREAQVIALLETLAQRELIIITTCDLEIAARLPGYKVRVVNGTISVV